MTNNTITDDEYIKDSIKKADEAKKNTFDSWITDLEDKDQPKACDIDDSDCVICGS